MTEIRLFEGESVEKALRRLKKKLDREGVMEKVREGRYYVKPSDKRYKKKKKAKFEAMLQARRDRLER